MMESYRPQRVGHNLATKQQKQQAYISDAQTCKFLSEILAK